MASSNDIIYSDDVTQCKHVIANKSRQCKLKIAVGESKFCHIHKDGAVRHTWYIQSSDSSDSSSDSSSESSEEDSDSDSSEDDSSVSPSVKCSEGESDFDQVIVSEKSSSESSDEFIDL